MEDLVPALPEGWKRIPDGSGKFFYLTRLPQVKIVLKSQLENYHQRGRYLEMRVADLDFGTKTRMKKYAVAGGFREVQQASLVPVKMRSISREQESISVEESFCLSFDEPPRLENGYELDVSDDSDMEEENSFGDEIVDKVARKDGTREPHSEKKVLKLENERRRLEDAVHKLTLKPEEKVDHKSDLLKSARMKQETVLIKRTLKPLISMHSSPTFFPLETSKKF